MVREPTGLIDVTGQVVRVGDVVRVVFSDIEGETRVAEDYIIKNISNWSPIESA